MKTSKLLASIAVVLACTFSSFAQEAGPRLIVRADDMGSFRAANIACMQGINDGIISDIEIMVVTAWFPEAARLLRENPGVDVGLHLTLTSEWENVKWRPLTNCPSLCDENGYFLPMMFPNKTYPGQSLMEVEVDLKEVEQEVRAQIEMALRNVPHVSHITGHMGCTFLNKDVIELVKRLGQEYNIPVVDFLGMEGKLNGVGYDGPSLTSEEKEASFISMLEKFEPGKNYMFIDHPALNNEEMQTVGHIGYEGVAVDRQGVTDTFTSEKVKKVIEERGIELIGYDDIISEN